MLQKYQWIAILLISMLIGKPLSALPISEQTQWLKDQQVPNSIVPDPERPGLVISYKIPPNHEAYPFLFGRSWLYDNALSVIAWSMNGECLTAENTLSTLDTLVDVDGKLGFAYNTNDGYIDQRYRTGAIAWVGYSFAFYQRLCGDNQFQATAKRIADWVLTMQNPLIGSVKGGPDVQWQSTEHNIDAYFFLRDMGLLTGHCTYSVAAEQIKQSLLTHHWNNDFGPHGCFQQGINDPTQVLDVASWGALFLTSIGEREKAASCVDYLESTFSTTADCTQQPINGYKPYLNTEIVWSEGSLGAAMAYQRLENQAKSDEIAHEIEKMRGPEGGIVYACPPVEDFSDWESVAGTAWLSMLTSANRFEFWNAVMTEPAPIVDIKANNSDGPLNISSEDKVSITIELDPKSRLCAEADWWVYAGMGVGQSDYYFKALELAWKPSTTYQVSYQGPLFPLTPPFEVLNISNLPAGQYALYFEVDTHQDGLRNDVLFSDEVIVNVESPVEPWISVENASGVQVSGTVGPAAFCNGDYKIALYAKTDFWYVQPSVAQSVVSIESDCSWHSSINPWNKIAAHLVDSSYEPASMVEQESCPPLEGNVLAFTCYP